MDVLPEFAPIIEKTVDAGRNGELPVVRLDGFQDVGPLSYGQGDSKGTFGLAYANEKHTDDYLYEFARLLVQIMPIFGKRSKRAIDVILTQRNGRSDRDRLAAMRELVNHVPTIRAAQKVMRELDLKAKPDSYHPCDLWTGRAVKYEVEEEDGLWKKGEVFEDQLLVHVENGKFYVGGGDGYHRAWNEYQPYDTVEALRAKLQACLDMDRTIRARRTKRTRG